MRETIRQQPVLLSTFIRSLILLGIAFGLSLDEGQIAAVMVAVEAGLAIYTWQRVVPLSKLARDRDDSGRFLPNN